MNGVAPAGSEAVTIISPDSKGRVSLRRYLADDEKYLVSVGDEGRTITLSRMGDRDAN